MTKLTPAVLQRISWLGLILCLLLSSALAREPDWGKDKPLPIPPQLQGLWALGRHCNDPKRQLRVTKLTMQFGTKPPVRSYYSAAGGGPTDYYGGIVPDADDPSFTVSDKALTYDSDQGFLFDYGNDKSPEQLYYRCPTRELKRR